MPGFPAQTRDAVVLLSGGLDSATVLAIAKHEGYRCHALSFRYGQRHAFELEAARRIAAANAVASHHVATIDLTFDGASAGRSALTGGVDVPKDRATDAMSEGIPVTYVPARNTVFLAHALALAELLDARDLFLGVNAVDYSGYPDCRPAFLEAFERMANLGTKAVEGGEPFKVHAPLLHLSKAAIITRGLELGVDYGSTHTCYDPDAPTGRACGRCDACTLRLQGFAAAGVRDPTVYQCRPV